MLITLDTLQAAALTETDLIRAEIAKQKSWLTVASVKASSHWTNQVIAKIADLENQLAAVHQ